MKKILLEKLLDNCNCLLYTSTQWYTDVVTKAELISYSNVRGCMIIRPRGYAIWENIQKQLDARFKETGVENVYLPMLIPELSLIHI